MKRCNNHGPFIYLGPSVKRETIHLEPGMIFRQRPVLPRNYQFLKPLIVAVKHHAEKKVQLKTEYRTAVHQLRKTLN